MKYSIHFLLLILFIGSMSCSTNEVKQRTPPKAFLEEFEAGMWEKYLQLNQTEWALNEEVLSQDLPLLSISGQKILLEDLLQDEPALIFRYSYLNYNSYVDEVMTALDEFYFQDTTRAVFILATYEHFRYFTNFYRSSDQKIPIYLLPISNSKGPLDTSILPYFFVTDHSLEVKHPFVPFKELEEGISVYLEFIQARYFSFPQPHSLD